MPPFAKCPYVDARNEMLGHCRLDKAMGGVRTAKGRLHEDRTDTLGRWLEFLTEINAGFAIFEYTES